MILICKLGHRHDTAAPAYQHLRPGDPCPRLVPGAAYNDMQLCGTELGVYSPDPLRTSPQGIRGG